MERKAFSQNKRLNIYHQILSKNFAYYLLKDNTLVDTKNQKINLGQTTQSYILDSKWT